MLLKNLDIIKQGQGHIHIVGDKIKKIYFDPEDISVKDELELDCKGALAFPGLINSHDHLEFNLFPQLGNYHYKNYVEWGDDIHRQNKEVINDVLKIPKEIRVQFGIYKNLLNGVTTVVQHGEYFQLSDPIIDIFQDSYSLHSVCLEKKWKLQLNRPFRRPRPFVIHVGEGVDLESKEEINELTRWNLFKRKLIAIHGVAMTEKQARSFEALIWCPDSNFFLFNATADINKLRQHTKILFGTDSTLSANWNLWEQLRLARRTQQLSDEDLFDSLTTTASDVWGFNDIGSLKTGKGADIVVARQKNEGDLLDRFFDINPADILLVIKKGKVVLFDESMYNPMARLGNQNFSMVSFTKGKKYVKGDLPALLKDIKQYMPQIQFSFIDYLPG